MYFPPLTAFKKAILNNQSSKNAHVSSHPPHQCPVVVQFWQQTWPHRQLCPSSVIRAEHCPVLLPILWHQQHSQHRPLASNGQALPMGHWAGRLFQLWRGGYDSSWYVASLQTWLRRLRRQ